MSSASRSPWGGSRSGQRRSNCPCNTPHNLIPTPACRNGASKKIVMDGCLPRHRLRSDFLGVPRVGVYFQVLLGIKNSDKLARCAVDKGKKNRMG